MCPSRRADCGAWPAARPTRASIENATAAEHFGQAASVGAEIGRNAPIHSATASPPASSRGSPPMSRAIAVVRIVAKAAFLIGFAALVAVSALLGAGRFGHLADWL